MVGACRLWARWRRDERGSSLVEYAFALPVLLIVAVAIVEFGTVIFVQTLMEGALRDAARFGITGEETAGGSREERIRAIIADRTVGLVDVATAQISVKVYPSFTDIGKGEDFVDGNGNGKYDPGETFTDTNGNGVWDADIGVTSAGGPGDVVLYTIRYGWPLITPVLSHVVGIDGILALQASVAVRNEPWDTGGAGQ